MTKGTAEGYLMCSKKDLSASKKAETKNSIEVATGDGLVIRLVPEFSVDLADTKIHGSGKPGGLLVRDVSRQPRPNLLSNHGFEQGTPAWNVSEGCVIDSDKFYNGRASLRLEGPGQRPDNIVRTMSVPVPVAGSTEHVVGFWACGCELSEFDMVAGWVWSWRAYVIQTDKSGHKTAPDFEITFTGFAAANFDWTLMSSNFRTHSRTEQVQICWEIVRGSGSLWIDDVWFSEIGSGPEITVGGQFRRSDGEIIQSAGLKEIGLTLEAKYRAEAGKIEVSVEVADTTGEDRAVQVGFRLPLDLTDWHWEEHLRLSQKIEAEGKSYRKWFELGAGRWCNILPFSAVTGGDYGLALGIPMDVPRIFRVSYEPEGLEIWFDIGMAKDTSRFPSRASLTFVIYTYPGKWGFRAATQKYHSLYPEFFTRRAKVGMWNFGLWYDRLRNPEDFALRFGGFNWSWNTRNGMYNFLYTEPWGWWMPWKKVKPGEKVPQPSYEDVLARLRKYSKAEPGEKVESYMPMPASLSEIAQAILNSGIHDEQNRFFFPGGIHWNTWWGDIIHQYCFANPDLDIWPLPTRGTIARESELESCWQVAAELGLSLEGPTLDSLGALSLENYRREHWKVTKQPLVFNPVTRKVCQLILFATYDFVSGIKETLKQQNRFMKANLFPCGHTFFGHMLDVFGCEGSCDQFGKFLQKTAEGFEYLHTLAGTKPISFYDYDWWKESCSKQDRERRLHKCLFHGVFPGLPWQDPNLEEQRQDGGALKASEVLRPLCRKYLPAIERVSEAGWRAITGAIVSDPEVMVERYGDGREKNLCFAVRNETSERRTFTITVCFEDVGLGCLPANLMVADIVSGMIIPFRSSETGIAVELNLSPDETKAMALGTPAEIAGWHLRRAADRIKMVKDIGAFNTRVPASAHSIDLSPQGYVDKHNSRGAYHIEQDSTLIDRRGRPAIRMKNDAEEDVAIYFAAGDIFVEPDEEYELLFHYQEDSSRLSIKESRRLFVSIGFCDHRYRKVIWQNAKPMLHSTAGQWNLCRVRISVPAERHRMFIRFTLKGNDTVVWLGSQVLTLVKNVDAVLTELDSARPAEDAWLARECEPRLRDLTEKLIQAAADPVPSCVVGLRENLTSLRDEIRQHYPVDNSLENIEAWQRINDALSQIGIAVSILKR